MAKKHTPIKDPTLIDKHETSEHAPVVPSTHETGMLRMRLNEIDHALRNAKHMADFAGDVVGALDGDGAPEGYFKISVAEGNRLAFCCYNLAERLEELVDLCDGYPSRSRKDS